MSAPFAFAQPAITPLPPPATVGAAQASTAGAVGVPAVDIPAGLRSGDPRVHAAAQAALELKDAPRPPRKLFAADEILALDFFAGLGGSDIGLHLIPGVTVYGAANHWAIALASHAANFPDARHYEGDIRDMKMDDFPWVHFFWASPECPKWSKARGRKRDYDNNPDQITLDFDEDGATPVTDEEAERSRALMVNVLDYLEAKWREGQRAGGRGPVPVGVVENVVDCRAWNRWDWYIGRFHKMGYKTRLIALNSMHAQPVRANWSPQSRDRLYLAYWHESLGADPDWDKWLRPVGHCPRCDENVQLMQVFKDPSKDMGVFGDESRGQYVFRCPRKLCRGRIVEPPVLPVSATIDWSMPGKRIGDRKKTEKKPEGLAPATMERIRAGIRRHLLNPELAEQLGLGGVAVPPLMVPVEGRTGKVARTVHQPARAQTARSETALAYGPEWLPFIVEMRGGSSDARPVTDPLCTVTASGNHHFLATSPTPAPVDWQHVLVPFYKKGTSRLVTEPIGTIPTRDRWSLVSTLAADLSNLDVPGSLDDVLVRMLEPYEIGEAMAIDASYKVMGIRRHRVRQYGNAVTPPASEVIGSALVELLTGEELDRGDMALAA